jgi:hypothetical protein
MHDQHNRDFNDDVAYNLRRAAQERRKAREALSENDRLGRIEMAEIFEARAKAAAEAGFETLIAAPALHGLVPTLH